MCSVNFRASKDILLKYAILSSPECRSSRRPIPESPSTSFHKVCFSNDLYYISTENHKPILGEQTENHVPILGKQTFVASLWKK